MSTYITLLRGINVNGKNLLKMQLLKSMFEELYFTQVQTYIQSGNIIYQSTIKDTETINQLITNKIEEKFGFKIPVITITLQQLTDCINNNPFTQNTTFDLALLHCTFLASEPSEIDSLKINPNDYPDDKFHFYNNIVYLSCAKGYGQTKLTNNFFERKLQQTATTRNWKTILKLVALAQQY